MTGFDTPETRAAEDTYQDGIEAERADAAEQTARLAELHERPALGAYRTARNRPYPAGAPPLPPPSRTDWTPVQLAETAAWMAGECIQRGIAAEVLMDIGRKSVLAKADIVNVLRELLR